MKIRLTAILVFLLPAGVLGQSGPAEGVQTKWLKFDAYAIQLDSDTELAEINVSPFNQLFSTEWTVEWIVQPLGIAAVVPKGERPGLDRAFDIFYVLRGAQDLAIDVKKLAVSIRVLSQSWPEDL